MNELEGTVSRLGQWVRGDCSDCPERDVLVYVTEDDDPRLVCAGCYRIVSRHIKRVEACGEMVDGEECGATPAWRDPVTRKNEFRCAFHHGRSGHVFVNRWAPRVRESKPLRQMKERCEGMDVMPYSDCRGQVKPRAGGHILCDRHAGKKDLD